MSWSAKPNSSSSSSSESSSSSSVETAVTVCEGTRCNEAMPVSISVSSSESYSLSESEASTSSACQSSFGSSTTVSAHWMCFGSSVLLAFLTDWLNQLSCSCSASASSSINESRRLAWPTRRRRLWSARAASEESLPRAV